LGQFSIAKRCRGLASLRIGPNRITSRKQRKRFAMSDFRLNVTVAGFTERGAGIGESRGRFCRV
jgi:hypothetical protein